MDMIRTRRRGLLFAFSAYLAQIPLVVGSITDRLPVHPAVIIPPLLGLVNTKVEKRGLEGLGLILPDPLRSLSWALILTLVKGLQYLHIFPLSGVSFSLPSVDGIFLIKLLKAFLIGVFGIALWEELVSQGYIQTRLQEVWGFFGAILSALMFASLHLPSALLEFRFGPGMIVLYFLKILLSGFMLAYIYWKTKSTLATIMIHGFRNFTFVVAFSYSGLNPRALHMLRPELQILWSVGEVLLAVLLLGQDLPNKDELGEMFRMITKKTGDHFSF